MKWIIKEPSFYVNGGEDRMTPCEKKRLRMKLEMHFDVPHLVYDISNRAYVLGDTLHDQEGVTHSRHQLQDIAQGGNKDILLRHLQVAQSEIEEALHWLTAGEEAAAESKEDDSLLPESTQELLITIYTKTDFAKSTLKNLCNLIHEYLVCRTLGKYLLLVYPTLAQLCMEQAEEAMQMMKSNARKMAGIQITIRKSSPW